MPEIKWDEIGSRTYETGLDRGVLYLPDGSAVPWNGLISVIEAFDSQVSPVYFDGMKISDLVSLGSFSASLRAITYPEEFVELEGLGEVKAGVFYADQHPKAFGLCYRTQVGDDLAGQTGRGYKIHLIYNVTAIPQQQTFTTLTAEPSVTEFEWSITAVPEEIPGFRPTAHLVIETANMDPWLLEDIEKILYGTSFADASLVPMSELVAYIGDWFRIKITDNGDGTWTAEEERPGYITLFGGESASFEIVGANAVYLDDVTYLISDTETIWDIPVIDITNNGNGTWTADTNRSELIIPDPEDPTVIEIRNANITVIDEDTYTITDTTIED